MKVNASVTISAPLAKVVEAFTDLKKVESVIGGIDSIEVLDGPTNMEKGTKWRETRTLYGKESTEEMWVTAISDKHYVVEAESHGTHYTSTYAFTQNGNSTTVDMTFEGQPTNLSGRLMGLMNILFSGSMKKMLTEDMLEMKVSLEN